MASTATGTVVGYFATETQAETAVTELKSAGFTSGQIGIALSGGMDASSSTSAATSTPGMSTPAASSTSSAGLSGTTGSAMHAAGEKTASAWDRFKSFFDGSDVEPYADENTKDTTHSHEITAGSGYGHEEFSDSLSGMSVPEDRSRYFGHRIGSQQGAVVTVSAAGREEEAEAILERNGGDIGANTASYDYSAPVSTGQQKIQLLGEVLRVQKERISRGEVRIRKEIVTEQQTVQVPVTREELVIERLPVTGAAAVAGEIGTGSEIRIPLSEEQASIAKQTVVREEFAVGKRQIENVQEVGGAVRHEELEVDDSTVVNEGSYADKTGKLS